MKEFLNKHRDNITHVVIPLLLGTVVGATLTFIVFILRGE